MGLRSLYRPIADHLRKAQNVLGIGAGDPMNLRFVQMAKSMSVAMCLVVIGASRQMEG
jgi:hypothetical protein